MINYLKHKYALSDEGCKKMILAIIFTTINNLILMLPVVIIYIFISCLIDNSLSTSNIPLFMILILISLLLMALGNLFQYRSTFLYTYIESGNRRRSLAEKLRKLPLSFFSKKDLVDLTNTIMNDCSMIETGSSHWIPELIASIISSIIVVIGLLLYDFRLGLAASFVLPISFIIVFSSKSVINKINKKSTEYKLSYLGSLEEELESLRDLRSNNMLEEYNNNLSKKIRRVEKYNFKSEFINSIYVSSAQMILKLGIALVSLVGGILLSNNQIDLLKFIMFMIIVARIYSPLEASLINLAAVINLDTNCKRMDEILSSKEQTGSKELTNNGYDIVFNNVSFSYDNKDNIIKNVSFTAKCKDVTALIGDSGSGKTTISRLITRFWDINSGSITIGGMDISKIDPETLLTMFSIVFQDVILFNDTIMENVRIGKKDASDEEVYQALKLANCIEFVEKLPDKYNTIIGENGSKLSGGERQRISIARAFLKDAPIILMDEASSSLDVDNESLVQKSISKLIKDKTVIIIAHRMRTVREADKIIVLKDGRIVEEGSPSLLYQKDGIYKHMVMLQSE